MKTTIERIFETLSKEKVELKSEKIELSVASDIQKSLKRSNAIVKKLESHDKKINKAYRAYEDAWEKNQVLIKDAKSELKILVPLFREVNSLAKELGIKANSIEGLKELENIENQLQGLSISSYMTPL
jgi:exonuclease VII small subunit